MSPLVLHFVANFDVDTVDVLELRKLVSGEVALVIRTAKASFYILRQVRTQSKHKTCVVLFYFRINLSTTTRLFCRRATMRENRKELVLVGHVKSVSHVTPTNHHQTIRNMKSKKFKLASNCILYMFGL